MAAEKGKLRRHTFNNGNLWSTVRLSRAIEKNLNDETAANQ
jgi:hypothetical protein